MNAHRREGLRHGCSIQDGQAVHCILKAILTAPLSLPVKRSSEDSDFGMAEDRDADFETRLKKLRNPHEQNLHEDDEEEDDSPSADLAVQARVDSVALAKGRLSGGAASGPKDRLDSKEGKNRSTLPPSGAKSRLATQEKDKHTGAVYALLPAALPVCHGPNRPINTFQRCSRLQGRHAKATDKSRLWRQRQGGDRS